MCVSFQLCQGIGIQQQIRGGQTYIIKGLKIYNSDLYY